MTFLIGIDERCKPPGRGEVVFQNMSVLRQPPSQNHGRAVHDCLVRGRLFPVHVIALPDGQI